MAITINIYYSGKGGNARKFAEEMVLTGVVSDIRAEEGNIRYEYYFPMDDKETVLLVDSWKYDLHMRVERYVADETGSSAADRIFIRE